MVEKVSDLNILQQISQMTFYLSSSLENTEGYPSQGTSDALHTPITLEMEVAIQSKGILYIEQVRITSAFLRDLNMLSQICLQVLF